MYGVVRASQNFVQPVEREPVLAEGFVAELVLARGEILLDAFRDRGGQ